MYDLQECRLQWATFSKWIKNEYRNNKYQETKTATVVSYVSMHTVQRISLFSCPSFLNNIVQFYFNGMLFKQIRNTCKEDWHKNGWHPQKHRLSLQIANLIQNTEVLLSKLMLIFQIHQHSIILQVNVRLLSGNVKDHFQSLGNLRGSLMISKYTLRSRRLMWMHVHDCSDVDVWPHSFSILFIRSFYNHFIHDASQPFFNCNHW